MKNLKNLARVLVVEDDECLHNSILRSIRSVNKYAKVECVSSVESAEEVLKMTPVDLIISDNLLLGHKTGIDFWDYCKKSHSQTPFVMISALPVQRFLEISKTKCMPPFLPKPFSLNEISSLIKEYL